MQKYMTLFVAHTPFQLYIANHMLFTMSEFKDKDNYIIIDMDYDENKIEKNMWKKIILNRKPIGAYFDKNINERKKLMDYLKDDIFDKYENVEFLLPNIIYPLNNYFYGLSKQSKKYFLSSYPEGLASIILKKIPYSEILKNYTKYIYYKLKNIRFYTYSGDICGSKYCEKIYSITPDLISSKCKNIISIPKLCDLHKKQKDKNICLILGQPYYNYIEESEYLLILNDMINFVKDKNFKTVYYKPHHCEDDRILNIFSKKGIKIVEDNRCIEELIMNENMGYIIGFTSSALVNLKLIYGEKIESVSFKPKKILIESEKNKVGIYKVKDYESFERVFQYTNVKVIK